MNLAPVLSGKETVHGNILALLSVDSGGLGQQWGNGSLRSFINKGDQFFYTLKDWCVPRRISCIVAMWAIGENEPRRLAQVTQ